MFGELQPVGGGDVIPLLRPKMLIGRRDQCDIALRFANVSNRHCELEMIDGYWRVRDLGSSNHTRVNGKRVTVKWLMPGDELAVARHKFTVSYVPQSSGPPPEDGGEDISMSLLEKAGLAQRDEMGPPPSRRTDRNGVRINPAPDPEEDAAFRFLTDDE
jgi:adenylate cyclase